MNQGPAGLQTASLATQLCTLCWPEATRAHGRNPHTRPTPAQPHTHPFTPPRPHPTHFEMQYARTAAKRDGEVLVNFCTGSTCRIAVVGVAKSSTAQRGAPSAPRSQSAKMSSGLVHPFQECETVADSGLAAVRNVPCAPSFHESETVKIGPPRFQSAR